MLKTSHRPDGKIADGLALTHACTTANASVNYSGCVLQRPCKLPIAPMGISHVLRVCLQGGGVYINNGTVSFSSCTITGNRAYNVRAHAQSHRPDGKTAHALALILACATATDASVNFRMYVPQRPSKVPIAPMGFSHVCARLCLQGGGVAVSGGTVSFSSCIITGNTAIGVRPHAQKFPSPQWGYC